MLNYIDLLQARSSPWSPNSVLIVRKYVAPNIWQHTKLILIKRIQATLAVNSNRGVQRVSGDHVVNMFSFCLQRSLPNSRLHYTM